MTRLILWAMASLLLVGGCAGASSQTVSSSSQPATFNKLCRSVDTNHDGRISRSELLAAAKNKEEAAALYDMCDVDKTGSITYDQAYKDRMLQQVIRLTSPGIH